MRAEHLTLLLFCISFLCPSDNVSIWPQFTHSSRPLYQPPPPSAGRFVGEPKTKWNEDGRTMTLLEDFSYSDPDGLSWNAEKGSTVDGASIPKPFWSIIGGPFEGVYRDASIIHDAACNDKYRSWEATHEMFYRAMLTSHVPSSTAKVMYAAVYFFGPRWEIKREALIEAGESIDAVVAGIESQVHSTSSVAKVRSEIIGFAGPSKVRVTVTFVPTAQPKNLTEFGRLKKMIEDGETTQPGSISLEKIRGYRFAKFSDKSH